MPVVQRTSIDADAKVALKPHLNAGEALVWAGFPDRKRFAKGQWILFAFAIPWTAFALFWEGGVLVTGSGASRIIMGLFGLPFLAIGFFLLSAPFKARAAGKLLVYGVTDERVLLLRRGAPPVLKAYGPQELAMPRRDAEADGLLDVHFAVDTGVDAVVASPTSGGLTKVGFVGVPPVAAAAVEAVYARRLPGAGSGPLPMAAGAPATTATARGSAEVVGVKLKAAIKTKTAARERRAAAFKAKFWPIAGPLVVVPAVAGFLAGGDGYIVGPMIAIFVAVAAGIARWVASQAAASDAAITDRAEAARALLARWGADLHPKAPVEAMLDLGAASAVRPTRFANSPHSGALKTWHRHRWARLVFATACGSPVVLELIDKVKYKAGAEAKRQGVARGWVVPDPAVWPVDRLDRAFRAGALDVRPVHVAGRLVLTFRGEIGGPGEAGAAIEALYREMARLRA